MSNHNMSDGARRRRKRSLYGTQGGACIYCKQVFPMER